jgi:CRP-like cAMP-binding protein
MTRQTAALFQERLGGRGIDLRRGSARPCEQTGSDDQRASHAHGKFLVRRMDGELPVQDGEILSRRCSLERATNERYSSNSGLSLMWIKRKWDIPRYLFEFHFILLERGLIWVSKPSVASTTIMVSGFCALHHHIMIRRRISIEGILPKAALFKGTDGEGLVRLAEGATVLQVPRGATLFRRGDPCKGLYVVISGQVKLALNTPKGAEKVVELVGPGQSFGEIGIFLDSPYVFSAEALADSSLVHVTKEAVLAEVERAPRFTRSIIDVLSGRLRRLISDLESYTLHSGTERVVTYLLNLVPEEIAGKRAVITLPAAKGIIASRLNLTPEHFSRILREINTSGLIEVRGREIRITDIGRLRAYAG